MEELKLRNFLKELLKETALKILVTRRGEIQKKDSSTETKDSSTETITVEPLTENESKKLLSDSQGLLESYTVENWPALLHNLCQNKEIEEPTLMSCIARKSQGLPAALVVLNKSLKSIKTLTAKQRKIFKELILSPKSLDAAAASKNAVKRNRYNPVLRLSYELLKPEEKIERPVIACFWHVLDFYEYAGCAYYRDLIVHWMLEGYFDPVKSVEKAYQEGHNILMEFMNRGILKIQEDNTVVPEVSMNDLLDLDECGFFGRSCLGFNRVYGGDKAKGLGRTILIDDMIRTIQSKDEKITTLIVSGNRLRREVPNKFFERKEMQDLEVVVLFDPTFHDLVKSLSNLKKLRVLVIRDCDLIKNINELKVLENLQVLEVSGASYLDEISDDFFVNIRNLESLNLSGLSISSSPSTIENLSMLRCFILRDCPYLQDLPNFNVSTKQLEVIDIRGARDLKSYFDRVKDWKDYRGKNKNFAHLRNLEHLDFSGTQIIRLPIFHSKDSTNDFSTMPALKRLLVRNCTELKRLPQLRPLTELQVLDVSGAKKLVEMLEVCLEDKEELRILNISDTALPELADTINDDVHLNQLLVRNCPAMKELPSIEKLTHLEVFDVSGSSKLAKIDGTFEKMSFLHRVNLSGTGLSQLPRGMSELDNVRELIIRNCSKVKALPDLKKMIHLEILDVSGCGELEKIGGSFENMSYLCEVNLSGTKIKTFPPPELPKQSILCSSKRIVLANSRFLEDDKWEKIKEKLANDPEGSSFPSLADKREEEREKLAHHGERYRVLDPEVPSGVQIVDTNRPVDDAMSKAEYVSVSDNEAENVSSVLEKFNSVKGCWVERCKKMENLFVSSPSSLELLWISNLPLLKTLESGGSNGGGFKNLKKLSIDCCRNIETLFTGASQVPESLEVLRVKFCDQLKKLFDVEGELPKLRKLYLLDLPVLTSDGVKFQSLEKYTKNKCPRFTATHEELKMGTKKTEEAETSKDQTQQDVAPEIQTPAESAKTTGPVQQQDKISPV
ncbi:putative disease resistance protein [Hirschfeldia incana]|nr:putative disease resistance protein [Hirschfeldia incana]